MLTKFVLTSGTGAPPLFFPFFCVCVCGFFFATIQMTLLNVFWGISHLKSQQLLAGLDVPLYLASHRLDDFNTVPVEDVEHVSDTKTCPNKEHTAESK